MSVSLCILITGVSCTDNSGDSQLIIESLAVVDSIGEFSGPSAFGSVGSACILNDGRFAIIDNSVNELVIFAKDGSFLFRKGLYGEGPGEFQIATSVAPGLGSGIWVNGSSTEMKSVLFNDSLQVVSEVRINSTGIWHLTGLCPVLDSVYAGCCFQFSDPDSAIHAVCIFNAEGIMEEVVRQVKYFHTPVLRGWKYRMVASQGTVYVSMVESDEYLIEQFDSGGVLIGQIALPERRAEPRPEQLIQDEIAHIEEVYTRAVRHPLDYEIVVPEYFNTIDYMGVDGEGRLWALRGNYLEPIFDVFDQDGNLEFICGVELPDWQECDRWRFYVGPGGILAYPENPEQYPLVYRMELVDAE